MFAYPYGAYNDEIIKIVKENNFLGARTIESFKTKIGNPFLMGVAFQYYPYFPNNKEWSFLYRTKIFWKRFRFNLKEILDLKLSITSIFNWTRLAKNFFDYVEENKEVLHIWGHSWEIEKYNLWEDLEKVFSHIANRKDVLYLTNSELLEYYDK